MQVTNIPLINLFLSFIPIFILLIVFFRWKLNWKDLSYASLRMISQLLIIGYFLSYIFTQNSPYWTSLIVVVMIVVSSWISLFSISNKRKMYLKYSLISLVTAALPVMLLVTMVVVPTSPWYKPSFLIPLAGMVFANSMNTIALAAERFESEWQKIGANQAKITSLKACLIPQMNSFMAVGLVSLPGMMTGQILSGVSPLIAVRYQIVVMTMVMGAGGLSAAMYLSLRSRQA